MTVRIFSLLVIGVLSAEILGASVEKTGEDAYWDEPPTPQVSTSRQEPAPPMTRDEIWKKFLNPDPCVDLSGASLASAWREAHSVCGGALMEYNRLPASEKRCPIGKEAGCKYLQPPFDTKPRCCITARMPGYAERVDVELGWCLAKANNQPQQKSKNTTTGASSSNRQPKQSSKPRHHIT